MFPSRVKSSRPRKRCHSYRCYFVSICPSCARSLIVRNYPERKPLGNSAALPSVRLRTIATTGDLGNRTARAITWLKDNYAKRLHMEELARIARMGVSTLHHQFRALTAMSPLQYQKQLRLQRARERMLMDGVDATSAAYEVGYESVRQFSREYSRFFGQPPMRDVKALRATSIV